MDRVWNKQKLKILIDTYMKKKKYRQTRSDDFKSHNYETIISLEMKKKAY